MKERKLGDTERSLVALENKCPLSYAVWLRFAAYIAQRTTAWKKEVNFSRFVSSQLFLASFSPFTLKHTKLKMKMSPMAIINHGAYDISRGNYNEAIELMLTSLRSLKSCLSATQDIYNMNTFGGASQKPLEEGNMEIDFLRSDKPSSSLRRPSDREQIPIFQEPLALRCAQGTLMTRVQAVSCSFIAMYNLAPAYHLRHDTAREPNVCDLHKAASLYECAHGVLIREKMSFSSVHLLVLINNLASVHRSLGDDGRARLCLKHELVIFIYLVDSGCVHELGGYLDEIVDMLLPHMMEQSHYAAAA